MASRLALVVGSSRSGLVMIQAGDGAGFRRGRGRGRASAVAAEPGEVVADVGVAAGVSAGAESPPQLRRRWCSRSSTARAGRARTRRRMLGLRPVPSLTRSSSGSAARANRRTVLRDRPSSAATSRPGCGPRPAAGARRRAGGGSGSAIPPRRGGGWPRSGAAAGSLRAAGGSPRLAAAAQVLAVPGDRPLDGLAEVVPQVPAVGDLDRVRRAAGAAVGVAAPARSRQITSAPGRAASQAANESADRSGRMSTGRRVSTSTSSVP